MSNWLIAWRSIQQRKLPSILTALSMAMGVMLIVAVLTILGVVEDSFRNKSSLGYNMLIGAKGGSLQLTLNSVYYLSEPIENIPYDYYLEYLSPEQRDAEYGNSIQGYAYDATWQTLQADAALTGGGFGGTAALLDGLVLAAAKQATAKQWDYSDFFQQLENKILPIEVGRKTKYHGYTGITIPLCLGDYFGRFRVVGTTPAMFDSLRFGKNASKQFRFSEGRNFQTWSEDHGFYEAVVGATVAREHNLQVGQEIAPSHGAADGDVHAKKFTVVGILASSGTPQDRGVFINMEGFYLMDNHAKPITRGEIQPLTEFEETDASGRTLPLPIEQREVTAVLLRTREVIHAVFLENLVNEGNEAQAALPVAEIRKLFDLIVEPIRVLMLFLTTMICVVSGISILVSIYNSMSERRHEIAVMRALGAGRWTVGCIVLLESLILACGGGSCGWLFGHTLNWGAGPYIEEFTGVSVGFFDFAPSVNVLALLGSQPTMKFELSMEFLLIPALVLLAAIVGFWPAMEAYRTDVAKSLGK